MNKYRLELINKGWSVKEALEFWNITPYVWQQMRQRKGDANRLRCMIDGLEDKDNENI
jgi:hypothetical protein